MIGRLHRVFLRFCEHRIALEGGGGPIRTSEGRDIGVIDPVMLAEHRLQISGAVNASDVTITVAHMTAHASVDGFGKFAVDLPAATGPVIFATSVGSGQSDGISERALQGARIRQVGPFVGAMILSLRDLWHWKRRGDMGARNRVKERLGLVAVSRAVEINQAALDPSRMVPDQTDRDVTIVLPVYNAIDVLSETLDRVARHTEINWRMVLIEDCSTDPKVRPMIQEWAKTQGPHVTVLLNDENLGFIATVNRGLEVARRWPDAPVVLLNSDALVPKDWAWRLLAPIWADRNVASVTPLSNDAEIFTVPVSCVRHDLAPDDAEKIDAVVAQFDGAGGDIKAPTGVGFCMALAPEFLAKLPDLDVAFGRGYGEETDWCQKAVALGGLHVAASNLFVEHRGGVSFGSAAKQKLLERNGAIISKRYPAYDEEVQTFLRNDPLITPRLIGGLAWIASRQAGPVPVYIAHALGGGAETYLQSQLGADLSDETGEGETVNCAAVVLRVGTGHRWQIELHLRLPDSTRHTVMGLCDDDAAVRRLMDILPQKRIVYSCGVGAQDAFSLPQLIAGLAGPDDAVDVLVHDFFPISPSYTLTGADGFYRGVPLPDTALARDKAHQYRTINGAMISLAQWQKAWGNLIDRATYCTVFSNNSADLLAQAFPTAQGKIRVVPHRRNLPDLAAVPVASAPPVIGVLGNIGQHKGAAILEQLTRDLARSGRAKVVIIGQLDPAYKLTAPSFSHGSYDVADLPKLVARYGISGWLMPSIWPETFSFVIHEVLATGLPVTCFDIGAQADAVRAHGMRVMALPSGTQNVSVDAVLDALMKVQ